MPKILSTSFTRPNSGNVWLVLPDAIVSVVNVIVLCDKRLLYVWGKDSRSCVCSWLLIFTYKVTALNVTETVHESGRLSINHATN